MGSSRHQSTERLRTARILTILAARDRRLEDEEFVARRVMSLREQVARGAYRVDPETLAATLQASIMAGGI